MKGTEERFKSDTAGHEMIVLHDDGLYRHLRFQRHFWRPPLARKQRTSMYWFDLITVPGALIFQGDGRSFVFRRIEDMFEFFRGQKINPQYWAEKLTSCDADVMKYDSELFRQFVTEQVDEAIERGFPVKLRDEVQEDILSADEIEYDEGAARRLLTEFTYYKDETDRGGYRRINGVNIYVPAERPDFEFTDTWELSFREYDWWFLWALHGIVWGIAQYDAQRPAVAQDAA